ncbi:MAG: Rid family hydrolase [Bacteroidota bacterium]
MYRSGKRAIKNKDLQEETHQIMHNLKAILQHAGMTFSNVVKNNYISH